MTGVDFQNSMIVSNGPINYWAGTTIKMATSTRIIVEEDSSIRSNGTAENVIITAWVMDCGRV